MIGIAKDSCGTPKFGNGKQHTNWWSKKLKEKLKQRKGNGKTCARKLRIQKPKKETFKQPVKEVQKILRENIGHRMEVNSKRIQKRFYKVLRS